MGHSADPGIEQSLAFRLACYRMRVVRMEIASLMSRNNQKTERRNGSDRRLEAVGLDFPFVDSHGHLVTHERRQNDRRKSPDSALTIKATDQQKLYSKPAHPHSA